MDKSDACCCQYNSNGIEGNQMRPVSAKQKLISWVGFVKNRLESQAIKVKLKNSNDPSIKKASVNFESTSHVASVTVWDNGMVEFIVLDVRKKEEVIIEDREFGSEAELDIILNNCIESFEKAIFGV